MTRPPFAPPARRDALPPSPSRELAPEPPPAAVEAALRAASASLATPASASREAPDAGEVLASIPRADGELRVSVHWHGDSPPRPWIRVALWRDGWPVKGKGVALRVGELAAVIVALGAAMTRLRRGPVK